MQMEANAHPPWNFSWVVPDKLAAMACPQVKAQLEYIVQQGVHHLITLSPETRPPIHTSLALRTSVIPIQEFEAPSIDQIKEFINICEEANNKNQGVGVHCRMGRGRTGVMAACYLVRFQGQPPERAVTSLRLARPGSVETYSQERAVVTYHDFLKGTKP